MLRCINAFPSIPERSSRCLPSLSCIINFSLSSIFFPLQTCSFHHPNNTLFQPHFPLPLWPHFLALLKERIISFLLMLSWTHCNQPENAPPDYKAKVQSQPSSPRCQRCLPTCHCSADLTSRTPHSWSPFYYGACAISIHFSGFSSSPDLTT